VSHLMERDSFESYLRTLETALPDVDRGVKAVKELSREDLHAAVAGTALESVVERAVEEKLDAVSTERELWSRLASILEELESFAPEELGTVLEAMECVVDALNIARASIGMESEELIPLGRFRKCLEGGAGLEQCVAESAVARMLGLERVSRLVGDRSSIPTLLVLAKLGALKRLLEIAEDRLGELHYAEAVRNALLAELGHVAAFCSLTKCPEGLENQVLEMLGLELSLEGAKKIARSRSGELVLEAISRAREVRNSGEELEALVENGIKPLRFGGVLELLISLILSIELFFGIAYASYVTRAGVLHGG